MNFFLNYFRVNKELFLKYATVGLTAAAIDFSFLYVLTDFFHIHYLISATISFTLAALVNYNLNRRWTFRSNGRRLYQLPIFFTIAVLGVLINNNIMYFGVEKIELHYLLAKVGATAMVTIWNFLGNKYLTFKSN